VVGTAGHGRVTGAKTCRRRISDHGRKILKHATNSGISETCIPQPDGKRFYGV
jgi:hypothetical protein